VYPTHGLWLISDRFTLPDGTQVQGEREFVYFALTANTQAYLEMLPSDPCESFLDVGAGCGAAALVQARSVGSAVSSDICPRSTLFARFNVMLNGPGNVEVVQGSLYEPVAGRQFDRIGCHPPYDVSAATPWVFADGGSDGEFVIRGTIQGLPEYLAPGGSFYGLFRAADRADEPLEQRVRKWLGDSHAEFDIALVVRGVVDCRDYAIASILSTNHDFGTYEAMIGRFAELGVERLVYSNLLVRRKTDRSEPQTLRREMGARCTAEELDWLLAWEAASPGFDLSGSMLRLSPHAELLVRHHVVDGELEPESYLLNTTAPFATGMPCPEWVAVLVSNSGAGTTAEKLYESLHATAPIEPHQFEAAIKRLISAGVLQLAAGTSG
jgi:SAM-dependent methyltransferase